MEKTRRKLLIEGEKIKTGKTVWTKHLIPDVREWVNTKEGEVTFRLTQFPTRYGAFGKCKERIAKMENAEGWGCGHEEDTVEPFNTLFQEKRMKTQGSRRGNRGGSDDGQSIKRMMEKPENWKVICRYKKLKKEAIGGIIVELENWS
ncbi:hypothetical protein Zmor_002223 [Zophobas morio]|uniref:Uncharacterized protein n=1 Tax=Zophobas morio TaxID=2755281 RepID=A0AA38J9C7_9CUCU|nr:hypothetical protein Zmor_002223 [Zophobas morio]